MALLILACSQSLYVPTAENVSDSNTLEELVEGRKLYIKNCSSCHNLYPPQKYPAEHWIKEMEEMKVEAKITDAQAMLILKYVTFQGVKRES